MSTFWEAGSSSPNHSTEKKKQLPQIELLCCATAETMQEKPKQTTVANERDRKIILFRL